MTVIFILNSIIVIDDQAKSTQAIEKNRVQIINYAATHMEAITRYHVRGIILHIHSEASFLSAPVSKSRAGGITI